MSRRQKKVLDRRILFLQLWENLHNLIRTKRSPKKWVGVSAPELGKNRICSKSEESFLYQSSSSARHFAGIFLLQTPHWFGIKGEFVHAIRNAVKVSPGRICLPSKSAFPRESGESPITASVDLRSPTTLVAPLSRPFLLLQWRKKKRSPFSPLSISNCRFSPWRPRRLNFPALCFTATAESADYC